MDNFSKDKLDFSLLSDRELLCLWQNGEMGAFDSVYKRHVVALINMATQKTGCRETAKEMVQDVFLAVFQKRDQLNPEHSLKAYLYAVLKHKIYNYYRQKVVAQKYELHLSKNESADYNATETEMEHRELGWVFKLSLEKLPPKCREIFKLSREEYLSHKQIASKMNISVNTVEQHMRKALNRLRTSLSHYMYLLISVSLLIF